MRRDEYEGIKRLIQQTLPSLNVISRHFLQAAEAMRQMSRRLGDAVSFYFLFIFLFGILF
jgi:hypothetical protein